MSSEYAVRLHQITKRFGDFYALQNMNLDVKRGSIHSIAGENGAGKSTLMNVLYGLLPADEGEIYIDGRKVQIKNPDTAMKYGIGMVHQHFMLIEDFTVTQNIILGHETADRFGILNMKKAREEVLELARIYGMQVDPDAKIRDISVGMQQRVEILKALYRGAKILILDEPTAVLTPQETKELLAVMKNLAEHGNTVLIITHKLKEIKESSDLCTVIRRGKYIDTVRTADVTEQELASLMVGREVTLAVHKTAADPGENVLEIKDLTVINERSTKMLDGLSLNLRKGEIVGIAGVDGNGQKELAEAVCGILTCQSGKITVLGERIENTSPADAMEKGIGIIPEDRQKQGLVMEFTVSENAILGQHGREPFAKWGILDREKRDEFTKELIRKYDIRPEDCSGRQIAGLSGGNQQKVIIGREIAKNPSVLIAVQPTRGLDVGAIETVHKMLIHERDRGKAVLLISFEMEEILNVSDTIAVIYNGKIQKTFRQGEADENTLGYFMTGGNING